MPATLKTLLIDADDISLGQLGGDSLTGTIELTARYDRRVEVDGHTVLPVPAPAVRQSDGRWAFRVVPNDDPTITVGAGFSIIVTAKVCPRIGRHGVATTWSERIIVISSDPDPVLMAAIPAAVPVPYFMRPSEYVTYLETTTASQKAQLDADQTTIAQQASTLNAVQARNAVQAQTITALQQQVAQDRQSSAAQAATIRDLQTQVAYLKAHGGTPMPTTTTTTLPGTTTTTTQPPAGLTVVEAVDLLSADVTGPASAVTLSADGLSAEIPSGIGVVSADGLSSTTA